MRSIECTNPSCEATIEVPVGAVQVICKECNTWHFPPIEEEESAQSSIGEDSGHDSPDEYEDLVDPIPDQGEQMIPAPIEGQDVGMPPVSIDDPGSSINEAQADKPIYESGSVEDDAVGFLVTETGERLTLKKGTNVIGRKNADLIIHDKTVSRRHCVIEVDDRDHGNLEFSIYDIGHLEGTPSTNGVFISGRSLRLQEYERIPLKNGSAIQVGNVRLNLQIKSTN